MDFPLALPSRGSQGYSRARVAATRRAGADRRMEPRAPGASGAQVQSGMQRVMSLWPIALVAMVPSGQARWLIAAGGKSLAQRREVFDATPLQTRRPLRVTQRCVVLARWVTARLVARWLA
jgi:hypothetical protein